MLNVSSSLLISAVQKATRPSVAFDAELCRSLLTSCCQPQSSTTTSTTSYHHHYNQQQPLSSSSSSPAPSLSNDFVDDAVGPNPSSPTIDHDNNSFDNNSSLSFATSHSATGVSTPPQSPATSTSDNNNVSNAADEFANRVRVAVAGAITSIASTTSASSIANAAADDIDRALFVDRAATFVAKIERTDPDSVVWLPYLAAFVSVGGALAIAPSLRRLLSPATLTAVLAVSSQSSNNNNNGSAASYSLSPTATPPPLSPRSASTGGGGGGNTAAADESRLQRYARVERADRVRQSYVAVLTAVVKDWRLLARHTSSSSLLLLCDMPEATLVRDVVLQLAHDDSAAFWHSLISGIDPLIGDRRRVAEYSRSNSVENLTPARRASFDLEMGETVVRTTSPIIRTTSPLARIDETSPIGRQSATPPIGGEYADASAGEPALMSALHLALLAWRRAIDDDDEAARARLGDTMLSSAFLEHTRRMFDLAGKELSDSLPFVLRQLRVATVAFPNIAMSDNLTAFQVEFLFDLWRHCKLVAVASGCLQRTQSSRDAPRASDEISVDDESDVESESRDTIDGLRGELPGAALQRYYGNAFWSTFIALTSSLHAAFPWHVQQVLCELTVVSGGVAYRVTSSLKCNPLLAVVTFDNEMPPTAEAIQRLGTVREFERFASSLIVSADADVNGDDLQQRAYDEYDIADALEFERVQKRLHLAARLRAEVSSRSARLALAAERLLDTDYARQLAELKALFASQQQAQREMVAKKDAWTSKLQTRIENLITINNRLTEQCKQTSIEASAFKEQADERHSKLREAAERLVRARIEADDHTLQLNEAREQLQVLIGLVHDLQYREQLSTGRGAPSAAPCSNCAMLGAQLSSTQRRLVDAEEARKLAEQQLADLTAQQERYTRERDAARAHYDQLTAVLEAERRTASDQTARHREARVALSERVLELTEQIKSQPQPQPKK